jgi:hypothetical protein
VVEEGQPAPDFELESDSGQPNVLARGCSRCATGPRSGYAALLDGRLRIFFDVAQQPARCDPWEVVEQDRSLVEVQPGQTSGILRLVNATVSASTGTD